MIAFLFPFTIMYGACLYALEYFRAEGWDSQFYNPLGYKYPSDIADMEKDEWSRVELEVADEDNKEVQRVKEAKRLSDKCTESFRWLDANHDWLSDNILEGTVDSKTGNLIIWSTHRLKEGYNHPYLTWYENTNTHNFESIKVALTIEQTEKAIKSLQSA